MRQALLLLLVTSLFGCGEDTKLLDGTLEVRVWGESFIEQSIPADVFVDGWSVTFDKFLVNLGEIHVHQGESSPALSDATFRVFDLSLPSSTGHLVFASPITGGVYDQLDYTVAPATETSVPGNATAADMALLQENGWSVFASGTAGRDATQITFAWGFTTQTLYGDCAIALQIDGDVATATPTLHGDHLFYDDLFSETPNVAFDLIAQADSSEDGVVSEAELRAQSLLEQEHYQVGSTGITQLYDFIAFQTSTLGHIDGEGHCHNVQRD